MEAVLPGWLEAAKEGSSLSPLYGACLRTWTVQQECWCLQPLSWACLAWMYLPACCSGTYTGLWRRHFAAYTPDVAQQHHAWLNAPLTWAVFHTFWLPLPILYLACHHHKGIRLHASMRWNHAPQYVCWARGVSRVSIEGLPSSWPL